MVNIGIIGCGQWGPNYIRIFSHLPNTRALMCADLDPGRLKSIKESFPSIETTTNYKEILSSKNIDAICLSTPTSTHFTITREALSAGKHVLCEKPLALKEQECEELSRLAYKQKRILMVGHIFLFNAGINRLKEYIQAGEIGRIHYAYSKRTNLGPFRYDVNALWDLAPHDVSIFNYLLNSCPLSVSARGQRCLNASLEDLAFATLEYPDQVMVNIHVSWLDPKKVRQITIVGDKKMIAWDDLDDVGPVKLYDKHVEKTSTFYETYGEFKLLSQEGSIMIPNIGANEPLKAQAQYFLDCIENGKAPVLVDAARGRDVVKTLCAIQKSMDLKGQSVIV